MEPGPCCGGNGHCLVCVFQNLDGPGCRWLSQRRTHSPCAVTNDRKSDAPARSAPASTRCSRCSGELRLKRVDPDDGPFESMKEIFVWANCGHELSCIVAPDKYAGLAPLKPHALRRQPWGSRSSARGCHRPADETGLREVERPRLIAGFPYTRRDAEM